ncbi:hypothetical protein HD599_001397 [Conyzicola lurida]|uniref:DarT domain-containing protein n=1 Tax=Conyzicola lurida TaxID=1172621 RepID=A0A841AL06_9MICO|nr:hypothetical protein [Conyzicola lurida]
MAKTRVTRPRASSLTAPRKPATASSLRNPPVEVGDQRIYHVTHVSNLADILSSGRLLADASDAWEKRPTVDISSDETRESRRTIVVSDENDASVASYVPFFLSPTSSVWVSVRERVADPRLSAATREAVASDYVILVSSVKSVVDAHDAEEAEREAAVVVTDGDAAHTLTRFATTREAGDRVLRKLRADEESVQILAAEYLVKDEFPFELVSLIGVANDKARDAVKAIVKGSGFSTRVAVYPPWFMRVD